MNPTSSADDSTVDRELSLATRDRACTVLAAAAASVARGIAPPGFISRHHSSNLRRNRILRSSSGSRGPGSPNLNLFTSLLFALPPNSSGQWKRRDDGQGCGGRGRTHNRSRWGLGSISLRPLVEAIPPPFYPSLSLLGPSAHRAFVDQPFHRFPETADLSFQKAHLSRSCASLTYVTPMTSF